MGKKFWYSRIRVSQQQTVHDCEGRLSSISLFKPMLNVKVVQVFFTNFERVYQTLAHFIKIITFSKYHTVKLGYNDHDTLLTAACCPKRDFYVCTNGTN